MGCPAVQVRFDISLSLLFVLSSAVLVCTSFAPIYFAGVEGIEDTAHALIAALTRDVLSRTRHHFEVPMNVSRLMGEVLRHGALRPLEAPAEAERTARVFLEATRLFPANVYTQVGMADEGTFIGLENQVTFMKDEFRLEVRNATDYAARYTYQIFEHNGSGMATDYSASCPPAPGGAAAAPAPCPAGRQCWLLAGNCSGASRYDGRAGGGCCAAPVPQGADYGSCVSGSDAGCCPAADPAAPATCCPDSQCRIDTAAAGCADCAAQGKGGCQCFIYTKVDFDPRLRPWYKVPAQTWPYPTWTDPYVYSNGLELAVSGGVLIKKHDGTDLGVFAVDVALSSLEHFLHSIPYGKTGRAMVINRRSTFALATSWREPVARRERLQCVGSSDPTCTETDWKGLLEFEESSVRDVLVGMGAHCGPDKLVAWYAPEDPPAYHTTHPCKYSGKPIVDQNDKQFVTRSMFVSLTRLVSDQPMSPLNGLDLQILIVIPKEDYLGDIQRQQILVIIIVISMDAVIVFAGVCFVKSVSNIMNNLSQQMKVVAKLELEHQFGISSFVTEFSKMNESFLQMIQHLTDWKKYIPEEVQDREFSEGSEEAGEGVTEDNLRLKDNLPQSAPRKVEDSNCTSRVNPSVENSEMSDANQLGGSLQIPGIAREITEFVVDTRAVTSPTQVKTPKSDREGSPRWAVGTPTTPGRNLRRPSSSSQGKLMTKLSGLRARVAKQTSGLGVPKSSTVLSGIKARRASLKGGKEGGLQHVGSCGMSQRQATVAWMNASLEYAQLTGQFGWSEFLEHALRHARMAQGVISSFTFDTVCLTWNAQNSSPQHPQKMAGFAVRVSSGPLAADDATWYIGGSTGSVICGTAGDDRTRKPVVSGKVVQLAEELLPLAARLCVRVLLGEGVKERLDAGQHCTRAVDVVQTDAAFSHSDARGGSATSSPPSRVFELMPPSPDDAELAVYHDAFHHMMQADFASASDAFAAYHRNRAEDTQAERLARLTASLKGAWPQSRVRYIRRRLGWETFASEGPKDLCVSSMSVSNGPLSAPSKIGLGNPAASFGAIRSPAPRASLPGVPVDAIGRSGRHQSGDADHLRHMLNAASKVDLKGRRTSEAVPLDAASSPQPAASFILTDSLAGAQPRPPPADPDDTVGTSPMGIHRPSRGNGYVPLPDPNMSMDTDMSPPVGIRRPARGAAPAAGMADTADMRGMQTAELDPQYHTGRQDSTTIPQLLAGSRAPLAGLPAPGGPDSARSGSDVKSKDSPRTATGQRLHSISAPELPDHFHDTQSRVWRRAGKMLGRGAFGIVWLGMGADGALVAIKTLPVPQSSVPVRSKTSKSDTPRDNDELNDILQEIKLLETINHDNVVAYFGCTICSMSIVIVMEYLPGGSLQGILDKFQGKLARTSAQRYTKDMLRGLDFLHESLVVHRDMKPGNVLLTVEGLCKLCDFGASASVKTVSDGDRRAVGTPLFMAPEAMLGQAVRPTDIWAMGVTVLSTFTGAAPIDLYRYEGAWDPHRFMYQFRRTTDFGPHIPEWILDVQLRDFVSACLQSDPEKRPTCRDLLDFRLLF